MTLGAHFLDALERRERAVAKALDLVGLAPGASAYTRELYPHDSPAVAAQMATRQSGCGLTCEAILRAAGVDDEVLLEPYGPRCTGKGPYAVVHQVALALQCGAWVDTMHVDADPDMFVPPQPGDMWLQGLGNASGAVPGWYRGTQAAYEHVGTVVETGEGRRFASVEGGQPGILRKPRRWVVTRRGELWVCSEGVSLDSDGAPSKGARVQGYLVLTALPFREGS